MIIDLTAVAFVTAAVLHALDEVAAACSDRHIPLRLVATTGAWSTEVLRKYPAHGNLSVFDTVAAALASDQPPRGLFFDPALSPVAGVSARQGHTEQAAVDAEMWASRRAILALFHRRLRDDMATLIAPDFSALADEQLVLSALATIAIRLADACDVRIYDSATRSLPLVRQRGLPRSVIGQAATLDVTAGSAVTAAARTGEPVLVDDVATSPLFTDQPTREVLLAAGTRAMHCYPLHDDHHRLRAILSLHYHTAGRHPGQQTLARYAEQALTRLAVPLTRVATGRATTGQPMVDDTAVAPTATDTPTIGVPGTP
ncbi:GAF domain-containing protein [Actinoplanes sp. RD1]|uniref:GAF domain-containing protein n=1 Tax=Actinoplanes sp. RD1 TaxID=3064538 RepID=UPI0027421095|nr:GAF domain-containing protein [Actinoplanes sp. RD1]